MCDFSERGGILSHSASETQCAAFVGEVGKRDAFSPKLCETFEGRKEKQDKGVTSPATPLQASNAPHTCPQAGVSEANRPQCGRLLGRRCADVFQVHGFGGKSRKKTCLWDQRSSKRRWLQGSFRCHEENPRFEDDKYRLRGTVQGICPSRPLRQRARPTPLSRLDTPRKSCAALTKEKTAL